MIQFLYATHSNRMICLGWRMLYDKKTLPDSTNVWQEQQRNAQELAQQLIRCRCNIVQRSLQRRFTFRSFKSHLLDMSGMEYHKPSTALLADCPQPLPLPESHSRTRVSPGLEPYRETARSSTFNPYCDTNNNCIDQSRWTLNQGSGIWWSRGNEKSNRSAYQHFNKGRRLSEHNWQKQRQHQHTFGR